MLNYPNDTYITLEDAREYADFMALVLPDDDTEAEQVLKRSAIYLDRLYGNRYIGNRTSSTYSLYWPRTVSSFYDSLGNYRTDLAYNSIPVELGQAQTELAAMLNENPDLNVFAQPEPALKKKKVKVGELEKDLEYASNSGYTETPWNKLDVLLAPLLKKANGQLLSMTRGG